MSMLIDDFGLATTSINGIRGLEDIVVIKTAW